MNVNLKCPEKVGIEKQKSEKSNPSKSTIDKDLKALDTKWLDRFLQFETILVANTLEKLAEQTFQTVTLMPAGAVDSLWPFLLPTNPTAQANIH